MWDVSALKVELLSCIYLHLIILLAGAHEQEVAYTFHFCETSCDTATQCLVCCPDITYKAPRQENHTFAEGYFTGTTPGSLVQRDRWMDAVMDEQAAEEAVSTFPILQ